ncbi:MAG: CmpA/NrtA family ABC transporter substrate-binding protein [Sinimarinibacterium flocculans]|uniref:Nitrate/nitrite transport system substrate-binding protein n=1 Tax=Sinimarinibacterium flocculans TaxID=985250 RepID=A0A318EBZ7_9GAMM|nr:CmpA/NrtA family ABC transporter substrate-binding protein [Sinimarinibacterium flocculans]MEC9363732.1 CmpA/NrtA family ABC transporter substrate-binding protein [Pseudomonadota bacterium]PXV64999.1 nitrate/nitrite transport system substrate-binding protein [Sinimarinibacterium flocculans]
MSANVLEKDELRLGVIPLVDAAPLIVARDRGFFAKQGLEVEVSVEASWASVRDKVATGLLDGAQMLAPMPLAATLGIDGIGVPMVTAMTLNLNGNSIAVSESLYRELQLREREPLSAGRALKGLLLRDRIIGRRQRAFAHVFPFSTHHYVLRYWLAACGIDPDRDVRLEVIPPPLMVQHLSDGRIDGFCVGAPWGAAAEAAGVGYRVVNTFQIWNNAPEKVLGVTRAWAAAHPRTHRALIAALIDACRWLDMPGNRAEGAQILIDSGAVDAPPATIRTALEVPSAGDSFFGTGLVFHRHAANFPWLSHAMWFVEQMRRWGQIDTAIDAADIAAQVYRPQVCREAAAMVGVPCPQTDHKSEGMHAGIWALRLPSGLLTMGPDAFFDGAVYGTDGVPAEVS